MRKTKRPDSIDVVELYKAILRDYLASYPTDHEDVMRDYKCIALQSRSRGLAFFTLDLPEIGKVLDRATSLGRLDRSTLPLMRRRWRGSSIPRLFSGLWVRLFERDGRLRSDIDPTVLSFLRTLLYAGKKTRLKCKPQRVYDAIKEYYDVEARIEHPVPRIFEGDPDSSEWRRDIYDLETLAERQEDPHHGLPLLSSEPGTRRGSSDGGFSISELLRSAQRFAGIASSGFGVFSPEHVLAKHGPGAVSEVLRDGTKYMFPSWSPRLEHLFPWDVYGVTTVDNFLSNSVPIPELLPREVEHHSKLIAVPKTQKGPRLIASEPVCHQWIQQGIARVLVERVAQTPLRYSLDFHSQERSREAALEASLTGERSTIDLSSASDRLSAAVVASVLRSNISLLRLIAACRTRYLFNPLDKKFPKFMKLRKFASMGSALTFPIQSIVFAILAVGVGSRHSPEATYDDLCKEVRVFGDDIIVPKEWVGDLVRVLHALGLKVNSSKTFTEGNFRESCGMDAFRGYDVTPAYIRWLSTEFDSDSAVGYVAVANNFFMKGYWRAAHYLETAAPWVSRLPAVAAHVAALGRATFSRGIDPSLRQRWDDNLQKYVVPLLRVSSAKRRTVTNENPNGFMEYCVRINARIHPVEEIQRLGGYSNSWLDTLFPDSQFLTISEMVAKPPKGARASLRRAWVPVELLTGM